VRVGQPLRVSGLAEATGGPAFSTCAGLLIYSQISPLETAGVDDDAASAAPRGHIRRFGRWLKENF
jgi:cell division protein FtsA